MGSLKSKFFTYPEHSFYLEKDIAALEVYLKQQGWLDPEDSVIKVEKPGEGNMNFVLRVIPKDSKSFIVKQARPWVEKYPQLAAPTDRIKVEHTYYQHLAKHRHLQNYSPKMSGFDPKNNLMALQDLGKASDFSFVYQKKHHFKSHQLREAVMYLNELKAVDQPLHYPENLTLRRLNHQHIFVLPFTQENGFDLDGIQRGLQMLAERCKADTELIEKVARLGEIYLQPGHILVHGDFYPGSLLKVDGSLKVIDPEFSFIGPTEWDLAIFLAHLYLAQTPEDVIQLTYNLYQKDPKFDEALFVGFLSVEILRRLVGLAQLPLEMELDEKSYLIDRAVYWIKQEWMEILG